MKTQIIKFKNGATLSYKRRKIFNVTSLCAGFYAGHNYNGGQWGLPHLLEHMMMKQTKNRSQEQVIEDKTKITFLNAFTSHDFLMVNFTESNRRADKCFEFASDCLFNTAFDEERFKNEKKVVLEEKKQKQSESTHDFDFQSYMYIHEHKELDPDFIFGTKEMLDSYTIEDLENFRKKNFVADKFILTICTSLSKRKVLKLVKKYFIDNLPLQESPSEILPPLSDNIEIDQSIKTYQTQDNDYKVRVYFSFDSEIDEFRTNPCMRFISRPFRSISKMFYQEARRLGLIYSGYVIPDYSSLTTKNAMLVHFSTSKYENISKIFDLLNQTIVSLKNGSFSQEYLDQCKENAINDLDNEKYSKYSETCSLNLYTYLERGKVSFPRKKTKIKAIEKVTLVDINNCINRVFDKNNKLNIFMQGNFEGLNVPTIEEYKEQIYKSIE